ncbi:MAG: dihydropyrimidinase [Roseobacter sp.]
MAAFEGRALNLFESCSRAAIVPLESEEGGKAVMYDLGVRNGQVVTPDGVTNADVAITNGRIVSVGSELGAARQNIDAMGQWVMPGGIDPHTHIEQMSGMGLMNADTFETAGRSALMGGTTTVISFAAQPKGTRLRDAVSDYAARAARGALTDYAFHLIVADPSVPDFEQDIRQLAQAGHRSLKIFTTYNIALDDAAILRTMRCAKEAGALVCVHAENDAIINEARAGLIANGHTTPRDHARSRPRMAEIEAVERMCRFAEYTGARVMLFHISTAEGAEAVAAARKRGAPVWAETCPHYLFMTEEVLDWDEGGKWMCSPPQRTKADQEALWQALSAGDVQMVSSDHAPYRYDATGKLSAGPTPPFHEIANGLPGLETRLPLLFDKMLYGPRADPCGFARVTASAAADFYGLRSKGRIAPGFDADLVVWDPSAAKTYGEDDLHDNAGYNPWVGTHVRGSPDIVILRGQVVVRDGVCTAQPGSGAWLSRPRGEGRA